MISFTNVADMTEVVSRVFFGGRIICQRRRLLQVQDLSRPYACTPVIVVVFASTQEHGLLRGLECRARYRVSGSRNFGFPEQPHGFGVLKHVPRKPEEGQIGD